MDAVAIGTLLLAAATFFLALQNTIYRRRDLLNSKIDEVKRAECSSDAWTSEAIELAEQSKTLLSRLVEIKGKNQILSTATPQEKLEASAREDKAAKEYNASVDSCTKHDDKLFEVLTQLSGTDPLIDSIGDHELIELNTEFNRLYEVTSAKTKTSDAIDLTSMPELERLKVYLQGVDMRIDYYKERKKLSVKMVSRLVLLKR